MKLVASNKDYWDYMIDYYGKEEGHNIPTWKRVESTLTLSSSDCNKIVEYLKAVFNKNHLPGLYNEFKVKYKGRDDSYLSLGMILISGNVIPIVSISSYYKKISSDGMLVGHSQTDHLTLEDEFSDVVFKTSSYEDVVLKFINSGINELTLENTIVTGFYRFTRGNYKVQEVSTNILLKDYNIYKILKADEVFKLIEPYVNFHYNAENNMLEIDDKTLAHAKGFNCMSFKKIGKKGIKC